MTVVSAIATLMAEPLADQLFESLLMSDQMLTRL